MREGIRIIRFVCLLFFASKSTSPFLRLIHVKLQMKLHHKIYPPRFIYLVYKYLQPNKIYLSETFNLEVKLFAAKFAIAKHNKNRCKNEKDYRTYDAIFYYVY